MNVIVLKSPKSTRASYVPGDTLRRLTFPIRDFQGREWPAGCTFRMQASGYDNVLNSDYWEFTIISIPEGKAPK